MNDLLKASEIQRRLFELAHSYFDPNGYFNYRPADNEGDTPWFTYPAITYLKDIVSKELRVFEFGSGYSTSFFNRTCGEVVSVEHDPQWFNHIVSNNPSFNIHLVQESTTEHPQIDAFQSQGFELPLSTDRSHNTMHGLLNTEFGNYALKLFEYPAHHFDIIVVDGMARVLTGYLAAQLVNPNGVIILDNSDRWQYNALQRYLIAQGFGRVDFWGPGPVNSIPWCTSFFSKQYGIKNNIINRPPLSGRLGW